MGWLAVKSSLDLVTQRDGGGAGVGGKDDAAGRIYDEGTAAGSHCSGGGIAALLADAGDKQRGVGKDVSYFPQLLRVGGTGDGAEVGVRLAHRPDPVGNALVERNWLLQFAISRAAEILKLSGGLVRGPAEQEAATLGILEEFAVGVEAEVGASSDSVHAEMLEGHGGVHAGGVADVFALGIEDDDGVRRSGADVADDSLQRVPSFGAPAFVESGVRLEGAAISPVFATTLSQSLWMASTTVAAVSLLSTPLVAGI